MLNGRFDKLVKDDPSVLDGLSEGIDFIRCNMCGHYARTLIPHLRHTHGLSPKEYDGAVYCEKSLKEKSEKFSGEKNPGYRHDGKLSPFSEKSGRSKDQIEQSKNKAKESIRKSDNINTKFSYWLNRTNGDVELAQKLQKQRQSTFSLRKCVERYGKEEGTIIWQERQEKWLGTLNNKSPEEIETFYRSKLHESKEENELFVLLKPEFPEIQSQFYLTDGNSHYFYDIRYKNKIIEFNGDFWHGNPRFYNNDDIVRRFRGKDMTAHEIWNRDRKKYDFARRHNFIVLVIWEYDFIRHKDETLDRCRRFIRNPLNQ